MDFGLVGLDSNLSSEINTHKRYGSGYSNQEKTVNGDDLREFKVAKIASCAEAMAKQRSNDDIRHQMLSFSSPNNSTLPYYHPMSAAVSKNTGYGSAGINAATVHGLLGFRGPFTSSQYMELEHQALIYKYIDANVPIPSYLLNPIRKALESAGFARFSGLRPNPLGWGGFHLGYSNSDPEPGRCRRTDGKKWRCSRDAVADQKYCERHMNRGRHRSRKPVEGQSGHSASALTTASVKSNALASSKLASVVPAGGDANSLGLSHQQLNNFDHGHNNHVSGLPNVNRNKESSDGGYRDSTVLSMNVPAISLNGNRYSISKENTYDQDTRLPEFGLVCSDALLNPLNRSSSFVNARNYATNGNPNDNRNEPHHLLRQFMDEWPKSSRSESPVISWPEIGTHQERTQLSISIPMVTSDFMSSTSSPTNEKLPTSPLRLSRDFEATKMGLGVGTIFSDQRQIRTISWEPSMGGPLGEVIHLTNNECKQTKALNLMESWDNSPRLAVSSPTGVLQRCAFGSVSNSSAGSSPRAESSKTLDGASLCNGLIIGTGLMHPSLPAL